MGSAALHPAYIFHLTNETSVQASEVRIESNLDFQQMLAETVL